MNRKIFSVYDSKAEYFTPLFTAETTAVGLRMFEQICQDPNHQFHIHAGDFTLFEVGEFDIDSGQVTAHDTPHNLGLALTFIKAAIPAVETA